MYSYSDLITQFRLVLRDPDQANKYFTDAELLSYMVDGTTELVREAGLSFITGTIAVSSSATEYSLPFDAMKIVEVRDSSNEKIPLITLETLDLLDETWKDRTGVIYNYYVTRGERSQKIGFYNNPSSSQTMTVKAWRMPLHGSDVTTSDYPELDDMIQKKVMN